MAEVSRPKRRFTAACSPHEPWVQPTFLKDAKLRVRERYWRRESVTESEADEHDTTTSPLLLRVIPDGITWRKFLGLLTALTETYKVPVAWYLTESAVELMDWRNQSPCLDFGMKEASAPHERSQLQRLAQRHAVVPLPDLSLRMRDADDDDEWNLLDYESMTIAERSHHSLDRVARMLQADTSSSNSSQTPVWILAVPPDHLDGEVSDDGIKYVKWEEVLTFLLNQGQLSSDDVEKLVELQHACEREYARRNTPQSPSSKTDNGDAIETQTDFLSEDQVQKGLRAGQLVRARLDITKENVKEAFVSVDGSRYFVDGNRRHLNRAFHYDVVVLQLLPEAQWGRPVGRRRLVYHRDEDNTADSDNISPSLEDSSAPAVPSARVVAILESSRRVYVATMIDAPSNDESAVLVVPMDMRVPKIRVHTKSWRRFAGQRLLVEIDCWDVTSNFPSGRCIEILGPIGDLETEISCLLHENQVALDPFSVSALACLPPEGDSWTIPKAEISRRRDLRHSRHIFSVDPPGCQDIDDTMHTTILPNGDVEVGVHIADVTYFVQHKSALDKEAQVRGTTFYLVDRRFDMLPSLLSSDLCSLHGGVDRLAVSVIWTISPDFKQVKSTWFGRTVIRNCAAMTYEQADSILNGQLPDPPGKRPPPPLTAGGPVDKSLLVSLKGHLSTLTHLARKLRHDREEIGGAVDLSSGDLGTELKFTLEDGKPVKVAPKADMEIYHTIAEMMILANSHVATKIYGTFPDSALLRIHRTVEEERFEDLREVLEASGLKTFDGHNNMALAKTLKDAEQRSEKSGPVVNSLIKSLATRAMSEAQYICTGDRNQGEDLSHYGLGLGKYTHFTSPIRRYADVVVHKQLLASLLDKELNSYRPTSRSAAFPVSPLHSLPASNTISVLAGEGIREVNADDLIDSLIEGASFLALASDHIVEKETKEIDTTSDDTTKPYQTVELSSLCEGLNLHNRLAKHSSFECQKLFLSLYFRSHVEVTQAVVVSLRTNGFWVYVPRFDIRGSVFLKGLDDDLQLDPELLGLLPDAGLPPSSGFAKAESCRRLPAGRVDLDGELLQVSAPEGRKTLTIRALDVVTVQVSCDTWDVRARVPSPRFHLLVNTCTTAKPSSGRTTARGPAGKITSGLLNRDAAAPDNGNRQATTTKSTLPSISDLLSTIRVYPTLDGVPLRSTDVREAKTDRTMTIKGRLVYGNFVNPDTRSAAQEAAQQAAAEEATQRRVNALEHSCRRNEYDRDKTVERMVTSRQQKLAGEKRSSRRQKAK